MKNKLCQPRSTTLDYQEYVGVCKHMAGDGDSQKTSKTTCEGGQQNVRLNLNNNQVASKI